MIQYLKSNAQKIFIAFALMIASSILWGMYLLGQVSDIIPLGFPLQFYLSWKPCLPDRVCYEFNAFYLILDFLIWYMVSTWIFRRPANND